MESIKKDNFTLLRGINNNLKQFANLVLNEREKFIDENLVIDLEKFGDFDLGDLLLFLTPSTAHYKANKSFILVNDTINIDDVPEELRIVPTLQEAEDTIQMEEIERDLGF